MKRLYILPALVQAIYKRKMLYMLPALLQAIYKKLPEGTGIIDTVKAALSNRLCVVSLVLVNFAWL